MFSIIIPLYNKAPYVEKAIQSVLAQTFREFELIVVDDGSTDNGFEIVKQILDVAIPPLGGLMAYQQSNQGVSTARNNGVKQAKYPYICFLDADDWWEPTFLEKMKALIESYPDAGIYGSSYFKVKDTKHIPANIGVEEGFLQGYINYCKVYAKTLWMPLTSISVVIPKQVYEEENGFKPQLKLGEDFDLWIRIALKHKVALLNKPLAYYNQDVDIQNRAVGVKLYQPHEHMLFTNYGSWMQNKDFKYMYERLALYGLLHYYLKGVNKKEVAKILQNIDYSKHERKYDWYYNRLPKVVVKTYFELLKIGSRIKVRSRKLKV